MYVRKVRVLYPLKGRIIFHGPDEELFETEDPYLRDFLLL
jgi:ABC-type transporter Mla maintaining outer membrane lipid asymmetry ATPase subunit MlaF